MPEEIGVYHAPPDAILRMCSDAPIGDKERDNGEGGKMEELWSTKGLRNARAKVLAAQGYRVKRYSTGRAQLHPEYIEDQKETAAGQDRGLGNSSYQMLWSNLYGVKTV